MKEIAFYKPSVGNIEREHINDVLKLEGRSKIKELEERVQEFLGCKYIISTTSWSGAMHLSMFALDLKRGDKIVCSVNSFPTVAEVVRHFDAEPIFCDIDRDDFNIDPKALDEVLTKNKHKKLKAVIVSHVGGQPADLDAIYDIAKKHKVRVVEDASNAFGATYKGKLIGQTGSDITTFGFSPQMMRAIGNAGIIATNNTELAERAELIRNHGIKANEWDREGNIGYIYDVVDVGLKYDASELDAAYAIAQFEKNAKNIERRRAIAKIYNEELANVPHVKTPIEVRDHNYDLYIIKVDKNRDDFARELREKGVFTSLHYVPMHLLSYYKQKYSLRVNDFPNALMNYSQILSLPIYPSMSDEDAYYVCQKVAETAEHRV